MSLTGVLCPSSGDLSESELLARSLRGLDSCRSFMGVLPLRFCLGVWPPSILNQQTNHIQADLYITTKLYIKQHFRFDFKAHRSNVYPLLPYICLLFS